MKADVGPTTHRTQFSSRVVNLKITIGKTCRRRASLSARQTDAERLLNSDIRPSSYVLAFIRHWP